MNIHAKNTSENKSQAAVNSLPKLQRKRNGESAFQFVDYRPEAIAQRKLQEMVNNSPRLMQLKAFQDMVNYNSQPKQAAQLQTVADINSAQQLQPIQKKENNFIIKPVVQFVIDSYYLKKNILPKLTKAKEISPDNIPFLDKMYSNIVESVQSQNKSQIVRNIMRFYDFTTLLNSEKSKGESKWHPTGGKVPLLDESISNGSVYLHFTNQANFVSILQAGKIEDRSQLPGNRPGSSPGIYVVPGRQTFNPEEAHLNLFLGQEAYKDRGNFVFAFYLPAGSVTEGVPLTANSPYIEAKHIGDIDISNAIYKGLNPFVTGHH